MESDPSLWVVHTFIWLLKFAAVHFKSPMCSLLAPRQLDVGPLRGQRLQCMLLTSMYLDNLPPDHMLLKMDFSNAFSFVRCDQMLILVGELATEVLPFVHSADSASSTLFWDETPSQSTDGVQQGDPFPCRSVLLSIC